MSAELEVLRDALARLEREGVAYMLTGSLALSYHAEPRMTRDIDLVIEFPGGDSRRLAALFAAGGARPARAAAADLPALLRGSRGQGFSAGVGPAAGGKAVFLR